MTRAIKRLEIELVQFDGYCERVSKGNIINSNSVSGLYQYARAVMDRGYKEREKA